MYKREANGTWTATGCKGAIYKIAEAIYDNSVETPDRRIRAVGSQYISNSVLGAVCRSTDDGASWASSPNNSLDLSAGNAYTGVAAGERTITPNNANRMFVSTAGSMPVPTNGCLIMYGAEGGGGARSCQATWLNLPARLTGVEYINGEFVAYGYGDANHPFISTTPNPLPDLTIRAWKNASGKDITQVTSAEFGNGLYVFGTTNGKIIATQSLATTPTVWETVVMPANTRVINDIEFNGTEFVAVADSGRLFTSTNGLNWIEQKSGTKLHIKSVVWVPADNAWLAADAGGVILSFE